MKIVQINTICGIGSTGKICRGISEQLTKRNIENYVICSTGDGYSLSIPCADRFSIKTQALRSKLLGNYGFNSKRLTRRMITELDRIKPDIVHIHNIHGHDCNIEMLLKYLKAENIRVFWTFHDCWSFTAYCPHFTLAECDRWIDGCYSCPQYRKCSFFFDRSTVQYERKKKMCEGVDLTVVTPSQWLADLVKKSFFKSFPVKVVHNGVDLDVFKPTASNIREKYNIPLDKKILLGVAFSWSYAKGLDVFLHLANELDNTRYQIVLVGTNESVDKTLPPNIISIHRTKDAEELAEIYSAADLFINPTREEVFGLVNIEANACGIPVVTFKTGGSPECISDDSGCVVECDDVEALKNEIEHICTENPFSSGDCIASARRFSKDIAYGRYCDLYSEVVPSITEQEIDL